MKVDEIEKGQPFIFLAHFDVDRAINTVVKWCYQNGASGSPPSQGEAPTNGPLHTFGDLLAIAERIESGDKSAELLWTGLVRTNGTFAAAVGRIELVVNERFAGAMMTAPILRQLRAQLCRQRNCTLANAEELSLDEAADALEGACPEERGAGKESEPTLGTAAAAPPVEASTAPAVTVDYVTLDQIAATVSRDKKTLERRKTRKKNPLPSPAVEGGGGKPDEWIWSEVRPWLEQEFQRRLAERFPRLR